MFFLCFLFLDFLTKEKDMIPNIPLCMWIYPSHVFFSRGTLLLEDVDSIIWYMIIVRSGAIEHVDTFIPIGLVVNFVR